MTEQHIPPSRALEKIGKYQLTRVLGKGATSYVYMGIDPDTFKLVAIKKIRPENYTGIHKKMFQVEASLCGKLNHPNIVALYEACSDSPDNTYLVMEYVEGRSLDHYASPDKLLPMETVLDVIRQAAEALNYAFRMGIIHRDVKPANLLLRQDGAVKLSDFGCALLSNADTTQIGIAGSLSFMSPEQVAGKRLNHQSDIYSIGAVLYRLLTGKNPFSSTENVPLINEILTQPHVPLEKYRVDLPKELCRLVERCLQKKRQDRYRDWSEFLSDLYACSGLIRNTSNVEEQEKFERIKRCDFFQDFEDVEIWEVLRASQWRTFKHNEDMMKEGEHGFSFFILLDGSAVITTKRRMLNVIKTGDCVGEGSCLPRSSPIRTNTVTAQGAVTALEISKERLESFTTEVNLRMDRALLHSLNNKLLEGNARILQLMGA